jgi:hypothetical protein
MIVARAYEEARCRYGVQKQILLIPITRSAVAELIHGTIQTSVVEKLFSSEVKQLACLFVGRFLLSARLLIGG